MPSERTIAPRPVATHFLLGVLAFSMLIVTAVVILVNDNLALLDRVSALQSSTLPQTIDRQRLARNLEALRFEGELAQHGATTEQRDQAAILASLIAHQPALQAQDKTRALATEVEAFLQRSHGRVADVKQTQEWDVLSRRLLTLADEISIEGVNLGNADLQDMGAQVRAGILKLVALLGAGLLFVIALFYAIRKTMVQPLQQIHRALAALPTAQSVPSLPPSDTAEIAAVNQAIGKLYDSMREAEAARQALQRSEKLLRDMGRTTRVGGWELHSTESEVRCTDEMFNILGLESGRAPTLSGLLALFTPESAVALRKAMDEVFRLGPPFRLDLQMHGTNVEQRWVQAIGSLVGQEGQGVLVGTMQDITARKQIEADLQAARAKAEGANQAKSRFLAAASHDLRQPAHAVGLFVARLASVNRDPQVAELVGSLEESVRAMQDMLDMFFDVSRLEAGKELVHLAPFPMDRIFDQLRKSFDDDARKKGLRLRFRSGQAWVYSEPQLLHRVLLNLVSNAIRYTSHGTVLVACRRAAGGRQLRIEVRDSGMGIDPQHHDDVFSEFFQVENQQRDRSQGLGMGLHIVERSCKLLQYPLSLRSAPGRGSCFSVTVPTAAPRSMAAATAEPASLLQTPLQGLRVLVVEDDPMGRKGLADLMEQWGCVVNAQSGDNMREALRHLHSETAFVLSDYRLGHGTNGLEVIQQVRERLGRRVAACLISGDSDESLRSMAQAADLVVLQKPVRPAKLLNLVRAAARLLRAPQD